MKFLLASTLKPEEFPNCRLCGFAKHKSDHLPPGENPEAVGYMAGLAEGTSPVVSKVLAETMCPDHQALVGRYMAMATTALALKATGMSSEEAVAAATGVTVERVREAKARAEASKDGAGTNNSNSNKESN